MKRIKVFVGKAFLLRQLFLMQLFSFLELDMKSVTPVIMCGGNGSRMWPLSRTHYPKQFIKLADEKLTMLQMAVKRVSSFDNEAILVCNEKHRFMIAEQLRSIDYQAETILLEPCSRNTAPAIALAAIAALEKDQDAMLLVLPADHVIKDQEQFDQVVNQSIPVAAQGNIVTFGIVPNQAETGYGYIKCGAAIDNQCFKIQEFVEKPSECLAEEYLNSGAYLWNSGMFLFLASTYLDELQEHHPDILTACRSAYSRPNEGSDFTLVDPDCFALCPDESIDYAVLEKTDKAVVASLDVGWSDVGSWASLWDLREKDYQGNTLQGDVICHDTAGSFVLSSHRLVSLVGLSNVVVVETADAVLVANKDKVQDIKHVVSKLKENNRDEHEQHRKTYRPWGKYDSIDRGQRFQVKHITVKPGEKLSLQLHHHRAEHWIVVSGTAKITKGGKTFLLAENQSTYISIGESHSMENPGKVPLELIEVQSGAYLGEDDIVRLSDKYGRA